MVVVSLTDLHPFTDIITWLRLSWQQVPTPTGKPKYGPSWYAVTECDDGCGRGFTDITAGKGVRFACKTCFGFANPVAYEGKEQYFISEDEALDEYGEWRAKQGQRSDFAKRRAMMRLPV